MAESLPSKEQPTDTPVIVANALGKRFGSTEVVRHINFSVPSGTCFGFLGPNGAGKTTTLRMLLGLSPISSGQLQVFGLPVAQHGRAIRQRIGVVPQMDNLDPDFTVAENLRIYGGYFGLPAALIASRIMPLLAFVGLSDRADTLIGKLSGGMLRRLTIARALINDPELVVLDEPTTGLDPQVRHLIWGRLRELRQQGKTLLLTTHYMEEAERLCDQLVIMDQGRIIEQGSPQELIARHIEPEVIEVRGEHLADLLPELASLNARAELLGDLLYLYSAQPRPALARLEQLGRTYLHRHAHLEDVFLKLTGRELQE